MKKVFGEFEFDERRGILRREGGLVRLTGQTLELLALLIERPGEVVTREEIQRRLWPDSNVEFDHSLDVLMNRLRSALSDSGASPRFIQTVPKRGYKFIERVSPVSEKPRVWFRRLAIYAAVAILAALAATLFARTRYQKFVPAQRPSMGGGIIEMKHEDEHTYASGYISGRTRTWRDHMRLLEENGFIKTKKVGNQQYKYVLLAHPTAVVEELKQQNKVDAHWLETYELRQLETKEPTYAERMKAKKDGCQSRQEGCSDEASKGRRK